MFDPQNVRTLAFDCVNTVFDISGIRDQMAMYINQVRRPEWRPLAMPIGWQNCPAHPDSAEGINRIREAGYKVVPCSNWPTYALAELSHKAGIDWSAYVPMETVRCYKPADAAYLNVSKTLHTLRQCCLMVTANETAPDIEKARELRMQAVLIDRENKYGGEHPRTIIELAEILGC